MDNYSNFLRLFLINKLMFMKKEFVLKTTGCGDIISGLQSYIARRFIPLVIVLLGIVNVNYSQGFCGFDTYNNQEGAQQYIQDFQQQIQQQMSTMNLPVNGGMSPNVVIPVVFHVIHRGQALGQGQNLSENLSVDMINYAFNKLNDDFNGSGIKFCPALRDANGNALAEPGVIRFDASQLGYDGSLTMRGTSEALVKGYTNANFPSYSYLNIWTVSTINGGSGTIAGFATFPGLADPTMQGIVMDINFFESPWHILTHEVGHYFGLLHSFHGDDYNNDGTHDPLTEGCPNANPNFSNGDGITDTNEHIRSGSDNCPDGPNMCFSGGLLENIVHNHMNYATEICRTTFTAGQKNWMAATIDMYRAGLKVSLGCSPGCNPPFSFVLEQDPISPVQIVGKEVVFAATVSPNTGSFQWYINGNPVNGANLNYFTQNFSLPGNYTICLQATNNGCTLDKCLDVFVVSSLLCTETTLPPCEKLSNGKFTQYINQPQLAGFINLKFSGVIIFDRVCNWVGLDGTPSLITTDFVNNTSGQNMLDLSAGHESFANKDKVGTASVLGLQHGKAYILSFDYGVYNSNCPGTVTDKIKFSFSQEIFGQNNHIFYQWPTMNVIDSRYSTPHPGLFTFTYDQSWGQYLQIFPEYNSSCLSGINITNISIKECCDPKPEISYIFDPNNCTYTFTGTNAGSPGIMVWDIDCGPLVGNQSSVTHTFAKAGRYEICLQITCEGNAVEKCTTVIVSDACTSQCSNSTPLDPAINATAIKYCNSNNYTFNTSFLVGEFDVCRDHNPFCEGGIAFADYAITPSNEGNFLNISGTTTSNPQGSYNITLCGPNGETKCFTINIISFSDCDVCSEITIPVIAHCDDVDLTDDANIYTGTITIPGTGLVPCGGTATVGGFSTGSPTSSGGNTSVPFTITTNSNQPFEATATLCFTTPPSPVKTCYKVKIQVVNPCDPTANCEVEQTLNLSCEEVRNGSAIFNFDHSYFDPGKIKFDDFKLCSKDGGITIANSNGSITVNEIRDLPLSGGVYIDIDLSIPCSEVRSKGFTILTFTFCDSDGNEFCIEFTLNLNCPSCPTNIIGGRSKGLDEIVIYPNPAMNKLYIDQIYSDTKSKYIINDVIGRQFAFGYLINGLNEIDVSELPSGLYIIKIDSGELSVDKRIIIIK